MRRQEAKMRLQPLLQYQFFETSVGYSLVRDGKKAFFRKNASSMAFIQTAILIFFILNTIVTSKGLGNNSFFVN